MSRFEWHGSTLLHFVNDELRAQIGAEHVAEYVAAAGIDPAEVPRNE